MGGAFDDDEGFSTVQLGRPATRAPSARFELTIMQGPDTGARFVLDGSQPGRVLLGQSSSCSVRLTDRAVSRRHAALDLVGERLRVTDLDSRNGTRVNGLSVVDAYLVGGEALEVGDTTLRVERAGRPSPGPLGRPEGFGKVVGQSLEMRRLYPLFEKLAAAMVTLVIEGETGTGKEVLAEALHEQGPRAAGPFVVFDCTAVPASLVESELFGHEKGAFTGAVASRKGVFEQAHGGTLFIDEIGDLDLTLQPKLLRALERSEARRVGSDKTVRFDVRVVSATRRDLDREVQAGRFRDDLFHRLAVARVELPPLRQRRGDVSLLARHFVGQLGGEPAALDANLLARWEESPWPGNVRELRNSVARHLALGELSPTGGGGASSGGSPEDDAVLVEQLLAKDLPYSQARAHLVAAFERRYVERALARHGGNVARAAAASGLARRYFQLLKARRR